MKLRIVLVALLAGCASRTPDPTPSVQSDAICEGRAQVEVVNRSATTLRLHWVPTGHRGLPLQAHYIGEAPAGTRRFPVRGEGYLTWAGIRGEQIQRGDVTWRLVCP